MKKPKKLKLGLPKGSLQEATFEKFAKAGFNVQASSRALVPYVDDEELDIRLIRAQEISRYVDHGYLDAGITGLRFPGWWGRLCCIMAGGTQLI